MLALGCKGVASALRGQPEFCMDHALCFHRRCRGPLMQKGLGPRVGSTDRISAFPNVFITFKFFSILFT